MKDFGAEFPTKTNNSGKRPARPSGEFPTSGKPKAQVNAGVKFPTTIRPGSPSKYSDEKRK